MVVINWGSGYGSGSSVDVEPIFERIQEFIMSEITCGILDVTHVMFGTTKEGIIVTSRNVKSRVEGLKV